MSDMDRSSQINEFLYFPRFCSFVHFVVFKGIAVSHELVACVGD
jgi:hypothetical protein